MPWPTAASGSRRAIVLEIRDSTGKLVWKAPDAAGTQVISPQAAYLVTDILAGNTDPKQNPGWASILEIGNGPDGTRRPAAVKTGTTNDARDLSTYGFLPPPDDPTAPAIVAGVWMGNSDHSMPDTKDPATSLSGPAPLWHSFMRQMTYQEPVAQFSPPDGVVRATIDAWSGGKPGAWTRDKTKEWFIKGTEPGAADEIDPAGLLYARGCGTWVVDPVKAELGPSAWDADVEAWLKAARKGPGTKTPQGTHTTYLIGRKGWGGPLDGACRAAAPTSTVARVGHTPSPPPPAGPPGGPPDVPPGPGGNGGGNGNGGGHGGGHGNGRRRRVRRDTPTGRAPSRASAGRG